VVQSKRNKHVEVNIVTIKAVVIDLSMQPVSCVKADDVLLCVWKPSVVSVMYQMTSINMTDALTEESSQEASVFDDAELIVSPNTDIVAAQLASAGLFLSPIYLVCSSHLYITPVYLSVHLSNLYQM